MLNLEMTPKEVRKVFLKAVTCAGFDPDEVDTLTELAVKYASGSTQEQEAMRPLQEEEARWYKSVAEGYPDYGVYNTVWYLAESFACWSIYSRNYLKGCVKLGVFEGLSVKRVYDLGCGVGLSTANLTSIFPYADIRGTNIRDTTQWKVANVLARLYSFKLDCGVVYTPADIVFASEFFEHIHAPLEYLVEVIEVMQPKLFIVANTFSSPAIGHFPSYRVGSSERSGKEMSRVFSKTLSDLGYVRDKRFKFWNNRPQLWRPREYPI